VAIKRNAHRGWLGPALQRARERTGQALPAVVDDADALTTARSSAASLANFDIQLLAAIRFGLPLQTLEKCHRSLRLVSDLSLRNLAIVGLKTGETVEMDLSERMRDFLTAWHDGQAPAPKVIEHAGAPDDTREPPDHE
jgi:hypothetical protein